MSGKITGRRLEVKPELYTIMHNRLKDRGWDSIRQFAINNYRTIGLSPDSVNRAFTHNPFKGLEPFNLVKIMYHLDYTRQEIVDLLKTYTDDTVMVNILGDPDGVSMDFNPAECAIVATIRAIRDKAPDICMMLGSMLQTVAKAHGVDIDNLLAPVLRNEHVVKTHRKRG